MTIAERTSQNVVRIIKDTAKGDKGDPGVAGPPGRGLIVLEAGVGTPPAGTPINTVVFRKRY